MVVASWSRKSISGNRWKEEKDSIFGNCHQVPEKRGEESVKLQWTATAEINHKGDIFVEPGLSVSFDLFTNEWEWSYAMHYFQLKFYDLHLCGRSILSWQGPVNGNTWGSSVTSYPSQFGEDSWISDKRLEQAAFFYSSLQKTNRDGVETPKNCLLRLSKSIFVLSLL